MLNTHSHIYVMPQNKNECWCKPKEDKDCFLNVPLEACSLKVLCVGGSVSLVQQSFSQTWINLVVKQRPTLRQPEGQDKYFSIFVPCCVPMPLWSSLTCFQSRFFSPCFLQRSSNSSFYLLLVLLPCASYMKKIKENPIHLHTQLKHYARVMPTHSAKVHSVYWQGSWGIKLKTNVKRIFVLSKHLILQLFQQFNFYLVFTN